MAKGSTKAFQLTESEVVEATKFVAHRRMFKQGRFVLIVGALVVLAIAAIAMDKPVIAGIALAALVVTPLWLGLVLFWAMPRHAKRHYEQSVSMKDINTIYWDDGRVSIESQHGSTNYKWHEWRGWGESHALLILFQSESLYNIVPKRIFEQSEIEAIKRRLSVANISEV